VKKEGRLRAYRHIGDMRTRSSSTSSLAAAAPNRKRAKVLPTARGQAWNEAGAGKIETAQQTHAAPSSPWPAAWFDIYAKSEMMKRYMHEEWGFEKRGDQPLFEKLCLEGAQAGLSWATILTKREAYRRAFHGFDISKCAAMTAEEEAALLEPQPSALPAEQIVRNRLKIASVPRNARAIVRLIEQAEAAGGREPAHGHFDKFIWDFVGGQPQLNQRAKGEPWPSTSAVSEEMSVELKRRGFAFVGSTSCYSFMQSCGLIIDHPKGSPQWVAAQQRLQRRSEPTKVKR